MTLPLRSLVVFATAVTLYSATLPGNHAEAVDAFWYAYDVEVKPFLDMFNPYHVVYLPAMKLLFELARAVGLVERPFGLMQAVSVVCGAATVALFDLTLRRRLRLPGEVAAGGAALLALSYGFWRYAGEVEIYAPAALLGLALLYRALGSRSSARDGAALGALAATAISMHALNAVLACVLPALMASERRWRTMASYTLSAAAILCPIYTLGVAAAPPSEVGLASGMFYGLDYPSPSVAGLLQAALGFGQTVAAASFLFILPSFGAALGRLFPSVMLEDEIFAANHASTAFLYLGIATTILLIGAFAWISLRVVIERETILRSRFERWILAWFLAHGSVCAAVAPAQIEIWIMALMPFWLLFASYALDPLVRRGSKAAMIVLIAAIGLHNLLGGICIARDPRGDYNRAQAAWLLGHARAGDLVLTFDKEPFTRFLRYSSRATVINLFDKDEPQLDRIRHELDGWTGSVYAMASVFEPPSHVCLSAIGGCAALQEFSIKLKVRYAIVPVDHATTFAVQRE